MSKMTIVTGLFNLSRESRSYDNYKECFCKLLKTLKDVNMIIYVDVHDLNMVNQYRSSENTIIRITDTESFKRYKYFDKTSR